MTPSTAWYRDATLGEQARSAGKVRAIECVTCGDRWELNHPEVPPRCVVCFSRGAK